jgi:hypothetical protein
MQCLQCELLSKERYANENNDIRITFIVLFITPHAVTDHCCQLETVTEIQAIVPKIFHILKISRNALMLGSKFSL